MDTDLSKQVNLAIQAGPKRLTNVISVCDDPSANVVFDEIRKLSRERELNLEFVTGEKIGACLVCDKLTVGFSGKYKKLGDGLYEFTIGKIIREKQIRDAACQILAVIIRGEMWTDGNGVVHTCAYGTEPTYRPPHGPRRVEREGFVKNPCELFTLPST